MKNSSAGPLTTIPHTGSSGSATRIAKAPRLAVELFPRHCDLSPLMFAAGPTRLSRQTDCPLLRSTRRRQKVPNRRPWTSNQTWGCELVRRLGRQARRANRLLQASLACAPESLRARVCFRRMDSQQDSLRQLSQRLAGCRENRDRDGGLTWASGSFRTPHSTRRRLALSPRRDRTPSECPNRCGSGHFRVSPP